MSMTDEERKAYNREYYKKNRDKLNESHKKWQNSNRDKVRKSAKNYRDLHPERVGETWRKYRAKSLNKERNRHLKRRYGITLQQYNDMFVQQKGCCAICGIHRSELRRDLDVDHNHDTGKVRELLCKRCNSILGFFSEDVSILERAIIYLNKHKEK